MTTREEILETERVERMQEQAGYKPCHHELVDDVMKEDGVDYPIKKCAKCGYWG